MPNRGKRRPPQVRNALTDPSLADVIEKLAGEFAASIDLQTIVLVVRRCQRELAIAQTPPGQLEPHARRRLQTVITIKQNRVNTPRQSIERDADGTV